MDGNENGMKWKMVMVSLIYSDTESSPSKDIKQECGMEIDSDLDGNPFLNQREN